MRWKGRRQSENVEDRRGVRPAGWAAGGGIATLIIAVIVMAMGGDPTPLLSGQAGVGAGSTVQQPIDPAQNEDKEFVSVVLADTEEVWNRLFQEMGKEYVEPKLVLFSGAVQSACGTADSAVGPFYCPPDRQVYIDLSFFKEMEDRFGAKGDFARAYVIAHEVGHHVQNLLGISKQIDEARKRLDAKEFNKLSVRMELQADFFAGVWAHHARRLQELDAQDIEEALNAANAIGDDRLQQQSQGTIVPDSFTHGTSAQRVRWFSKGWQTGDMRQGDTFRATRL